MKIFIKIIHNRGASPLTPTTSLSTSTKSPFEDQEENYNFIYHNHC